jgi:hypothetical protein
LPFARGRALAGKAYFDAVFVLFLAAWSWRQHRAIGEHALSKDKKFRSLHTEGMTSKWVGIFLGHCILVVFFHPNSFGIFPVLSHSI